ncbi:Sterile alpha motif domain-containing protein 9 [Frankliniella fusca]|uniref:Sterile alpha motif domain-containing protein 9 n=1 Tax=Frankliniella fusca TaxID=407009 RepID=A0AAE1LE86_9NEOP|nr:Sterile alpha motif domain-containing protein 9 [Frankliniella fusca]
MDQTSVDEFIALLQQKLQDIENVEDSIEVLKKNRINGKRAKLLKTDDFFKMGIPFGNAMEIEEAIHDIAEDFQNNRVTVKEAVQGDIFTSPTKVSAPSAENVLEKPTSLPKKPGPKDNTEHVSETSTLRTKKSDYILKESSETDSETSTSISKEKSDLSSESSVQGDTNDKFDCLKIFFPDDEWKELSSYDKSAYFQQYENFQRLKVVAAKCGKSATSLKEPAFMKRNITSSKVCKKRDKKSENNKKSENSKKSETQREDRDEENSVKRKSNKENEKPQNRRVPYVKKRKISKIHCHGPKDMPESEYIETLPEYDVQAVLNDAGDKLEVVRGLLDKNGIVFDNHRRLLVRTLTRYLFFESVSDPKDVTQLNKEGLAASICKTWPKFKDDSNTRYSWHMFFYRKANSGFIANCVQNIYKSMDSSERRRPRKKKHEKPPVASSSGADFDPEKEHKWISLLVANDHNRAEIFEGMRDSFATRRNWITQKSPSVTEILQNYLHLMSFGGQLLDVEFSMMEPGKSSFLLKDFATLTAKVKKLTSLKQLKDLDCEGLQVLLALAELLPSPNVLRKRSRSSERPKASVEDVVTIYAPGSDSKSVIAAKRTAAGGKPVQPYLLAYVPHRAIKKMFVVCDSDMIEIQGCSFLRGLDLLFKSYFVFNVEYPLGWTFVFQFLERGICKINEDALSVTGKELLKRLSSVQVD